eukprot:4275677-Heterocapsa_arctica.AAC.1
MVASSALWGTVYGVATFVAKSLSLALPRPADGISPPASAHKGAAKFPPNTGVLRGPHRDER